MLNKRIFKSRFLLNTWIKWFPPILNESPSPVITQTERLGFANFAPVAIAGGATPVGDASSEEEKSEFDIELTGVGEKKINVIKVIRTITSLGLKEAKDLADKAPSIVKETVSKAEAEEIKKQLEEAGATITLK